MSYTATVPISTIGNHTVTAPADCLSYTSRIIYLLVYRLSLEDGRGGNLHITIDSLASMSGKARSTVEKSLADLRVKGWIHTRRSRRLYITVLVLLSDSDIAYLEDSQSAPPIKTEEQIRRSLSRRSYPVTDPRLKGNLAGYVYLVQAGEFYKIGRTKNLLARLDNFKNCNPIEVKCLAHYLVVHTPSSERYWHERFVDCRVRGEWFRLSEEQVKEFVDFSAKTEAE